MFGSSASGSHHAAARVTCARLGRGRVRQGWDHWQHPPHCARSCSEIPGGRSAMQAAADSAGALTCLARAQQPACQKPMPARPHVTCAFCAYPWPPQPNAAKGICRGHQEGREGRRRRPVHARGQCSTHVAQLGPGHTWRALGAAVRQCGWAQHMVWRRMRANMGTRPQPTWNRYQPRDSDSASETGSVSAPSVSSLQRNNGRITQRQASTAKGREAVQRLAVAVHATHLRQYSLGVPKSSITNSSSRGTCSVSAQVQAAT